MSIPVIELARCELHDMSSCDYCKPRSRKPAPEGREWAENKHHAVCPGCGRRVMAGERILSSPKKGGWRCDACAR